MSEAQARTQVEHEAQLADAGYHRAMNMMRRNEEQGRIESNPYHNPVLRRWLAPLTEAIEQELASTGKPGRRGAHVMLLRPLDPMSVAFYAIRGLLATCVAGNANPRCRDAGRVIGKVLYHELVLNTFEHASPELFWQVSNDLNRRRSKNERHRYTTLRLQATGAEVQLPVWAQEDREQVGLCLIELMRVLGMLDISLAREVKYGKHSSEYDIFLAEDLRVLIASTRESVALAMPYHQPCIEPPKDWTALNRGGYHTARMQRMLPHFVNLVRANPEARRAVAEADLSKVMAGINTLQQVRWQVNPDVYEALQVIGKRMDLKEIVSEKVDDKPALPAWLTPDLDKATMSEDQQVKFREWKRSMRDWYEKRKLNGTKWGRMVSSLGMAQKYGPERDYAPLYFVYQADFRGRLYAMTNGISPQGSDLQKALLRFHDGKPLLTPESRMWFKIHGTSKFGYDKFDFPERVKWVDRNHHQIIECALHPTNGGLWMEADKPLQFLAWCFEYEAWSRLGDRFYSKLPIGFDGSCNGLQHFSAMLRDEVGGKAVNLLRGPKPNDIYQQVADVCSARLSDPNLVSPSEDVSKFKATWLAHGLSRKLVKRSVMTLPYGSTRFSCSDFIVDDYLKHGMVPEFEQTEYRAAATFLSHHVWQSIGEVVIAARIGMDWLQTCAVVIMKAGANSISWTAPSGFPVVQVYNEVEVTQVRSLLLGGSVKIKVGGSGDDADAHRHKNGIAPNFVHSMDASHLVFTTNACEAEGITSLAMIHDDYGTHAADAQRLYELIRTTFVEMYETNDPIADFAARYPGVPEAPARGSLDIRAVLDSPFFFA
jgi:DNA-directed RNA polymerase